MSTKKRVLRSDFESRLEKVILRVLPELPRIIRRMGRLAKKFDGSEPRTFMLAMEREALQFGEYLKGRENQINRLLSFLLKRLATGPLGRRFALDAVDLVQQMAAVDPRNSDLLRLMNEIDQRIPLASLVVSNCYADLRTFFDARSLALHALSSAKDACGEERAHLARDAFAKVFELVYKPYINMLWVLSYFRLGKVPPAEPPPVGEMLNVSWKRLDAYRQLLEPDAVRIRNAAVHFWPAPNSDYSVLQYKTVDRQWKQVTVEEMIAKAESMYLMAAHTTQLVGQLYLYKLFAKPRLLKAVTECVTFELAGDEKGLREAEQRAKAYGDSLTEPLRAFLEQGRVSSTPTGAI